GYASHFECDAHDARHLGVEPMTVQERSDWHGIGLFFQPTPLPICLRSLLDEKRTSRTGVPGQEKWSHSIVGRATYRRSFERPVISRLRRDHRPQSSSASRLTAAQAGFFI